jgi:hypothetical protein
VNLFEVPSWSKISNPYAYVHRPTKSMLITVGDSWTYGDSLGHTKVRNGIDDTEYRLKHVYGSVMSDAMDASWINLALPGGSNSLMLEWLDKLLTQGSDNMAAVANRYYTNIVCVITLTESGRHEDLQLIDRSLITQQRVLEKIVTTNYGKIQTLALRFPTVKFVIAHNFTDACGIVPVEKTWLEVMLGQSVQNDTHIVISEHIDQMNYDARFPDVLDIMDKASTRMDLLDSCDYCFKEDSRHPNETGHQMWAQYLLTQI